MEIRQLKYFINVAETGSFSEASRRCFLSQSAISQQIKALEDELGTMLFIRNPHKVVLTESGEELLPFARTALKSFSECREHMSNLNGMLCGQLNVGMGHFFEPYVRQAAGIMMKNYPNLRLNMYYLPSTELNRMLVNHDLDLAFSINSAQNGENIDSEPVLTFRLKAVMRSTHPLAKKDKVSFDDLSNYNMVLPEAGPRICATVRKYVDVDISKLKIRAVVNEPYAAINLVKDTNYVTLLPTRAIDGDISLVAKEIEGLETPIQSYAHWMRDTCQKHSAEEFLKLIKNYSVPYCKATE